MSALSPRSWALAIAVIAGAVTITAPRTAAAGGALACTLFEPGSIDLDGMLDDWKGVSHARAGGKDKDLSFDVRCLYDGDKLSLSIDVRDDNVVRLVNAKGKKLLGEDRLEISLAAGGKPLVLQLWPGTERQQPRRLVGTVTGKKAGAWLGVEDTAQPKGWSLELELPLAKIPGWSQAAPSIDAVVTYWENDDANKKVNEDSLPHELTLSLGESGQVFDRFLKDTGLKAKNLTIDEMADVDPGKPGAERVVAGGTILGVIAEQFSYVELPVAKAADIQKLELVDLRGDGGRVVVAHLRQFGNGGSRDVVTWWVVSKGLIEQLFAVEVGKEADGNRLESTWKLVAAGSRRTPAKGKKGKAKPKGKELVVEAGAAVGWDEDNFEEVRAEDAEPIHLPWDDARRGGVYWLDGETVRQQDLSAEPVKKKGKKR